MNNGQLPAAPLHNDELVKAFMEVEQVAPNGLTKREHFAGMAMQAVISSPQSDLRDSDVIAKIALRMAGALLKELAK
jgi:hypothetical protein